MHDDFYQMYLEEVKAIEPCSPQEELALLEAIAAGDTSGKERLIEGTLGYVLELTQAFDGKGVAMGDLVQEANMVLIQSASFYNAAGCSFRDYLKGQIENALQQAVEAQETEAKVEEEITARANVLQEVSRIMAEDLGREPNLEELCEKMKMSEDEVKDIMKLTMDVLAVNRV